MKKSIKLSIVAALFLILGMASPYVVPILAQKLGRTTPAAAGPAGQGFLGDYDSGITLLPTGATALLTANTVMVSTIFCHNTSATTASTVTITDNQGSPVTYVPAVSLPASTNPASAVQFVNGMKGIQMKGIRWSAQNATVDCQISGYN